MALTLTEIDEFREFAVSKLNNGGVSSLSECVRLWENMQEYEKSLAGIRESHEDIAAGRTKPLHQAIEEIRRELGYKK